MNIRKHISLDRCISSLNLDVIIDVTDRVEVGMILGGWGMERPLLIRSDGIICSKQDSEEDDEINMMPKYPQVRLRF